MPALEMAQDTGKVLRWLKAEGESVAKGEPIMEIETDKVTVEIEAPASGILGGVTAREGDVIPVGQTIAWILGPGERVPVDPKGFGNPSGLGRAAAVAGVAQTISKPLSASPVALQIAKEHGIDLAMVKPGGGRVEKADVLAYLTPLPPSPESREAVRFRRGGRGGGGIGVRASPKARRLAAERNIDLATLRGSGPDGAVLAADVPTPTPALPRQTGEGVSTVWRVMAERMSASWTTVPHFYLTREVAASALIEMRTRICPAIEKRINIKPTFTDLIVKLVAAALRDHPRVNASSIAGGFRLNAEINVGIAVAIEDGLIVPVIHHADELSIGEIAQRRQDLVARANAGKLRPGDISDGTFTITNLGMYNVDAFNAIVNAPQAAILAVGRIADRVVPIAGQPAVRPMMIVTLSCDHRVVDGARAAKFLDDLVKLIEEPWGLLA